MRNKLGSPVKAYQTMGLRKSLDNLQDLSHKSFNNNSSGKSYHLHPQCRSRHDRPALTPISIPFLFRLFVAFYTYIYKIRIST